MAQPSLPRPAMLLLAAFSRHDEALAWARDRAVATWGPIARTSEPFDFVQTDYYEPTMGTDLKKQFLTFSEPFAEPSRLADLPDIKRMTNDWETEYAALGNHAEPRPLNLDPGYLTLGKLILASTKDHAHRIYLARGIYAEITLFYRHKAWQSHEWTFADYQRTDYQAFFTECRNALRRSLGT